MVRLQKHFGPSMLVKAFRCKFEYGNAVPYNDCERATSLFGRYLRTLDAVKPTNPDSRVYVKAMIRRLPRVEPWRQSIANGAAAEEGGSVAAPAVLWESFFLHGGSATLISICQSPRGSSEMPNIWVCEKETTNSQAVT